MDFLSDALMMSRIQFATTSIFHYLYPPLSIGLSLAICISEGIYLKTKSHVWELVTKWWIKVFALTFALGVATGIVQMFGFGMNWARYSRFVGDVFGSALGAEGIFAFFLEAGFLGVVLFGWGRVRPWVHYASAILVSLGSHFSAVWIVVANSWMQTPAAFKIDSDGANVKAVITDFWGLVFNPSSMERLLHVLLGCWVTGAFLITSVSAYYLIKQRHRDFALSSMKLGLGIGLFAIFAQLYSGDQAAKTVGTYQPAKLAAMEGIYTTGPDKPISMFGWVDEKEQRVIGPKLPGLLSFLMYGSTDGVIKGLDAFPPEDRPPIQPVYQAYHIMINLWGIMAVAMIIGLFLWIKKGFWAAQGWKRLYLKFMMFAVVFPQIANICGWMTAEIGRQPWVVYNVLRTADGVTPNLAASQVVTSWFTLLAIYLLLFVSFIYLLHMKIMHGPDESELDSAPIYRDPYGTPGA